MPVYAFAQGRENRVEILNSMDVQSPIHFVKPSIAI